MISSEGEQWGRYNLPRLLSSPIFFDSGGFTRIQPLGGPDGYQLWDQLDINLGITQKNALKLKLVGGFNPSETY